MQLLAEKFLLVSSLFYKYFQLLLRRSLNIILLRDNSHQLVTAKGYKTYKFISYAENQ